MRRLALALVLAACGGTRAAPREAPAPFGIVVGTTPLAEARAAIEARGHVCEDASFAALMAAAERAGMPAGHGHRAKDPHLDDARVSCAGVPLAELGDGRNAPDGVTARILLVAGSAAEPVTAIAVQRTHRDADLAADDARATFAALERRLGTPAASRGAVPPAGQQLAQVTPVERDWRIGGLEISATAVDLGPTGISVSERIEAY